MSRKVVVIPTYNERNNITRIVPQILTQDQELEVVVDELVVVDVVNGSSQPLGPPTIRVGSYSFVHFRISFVACWPQPSLNGTQAMILG